MPTMTVKPVEVFFEINRVNEEERKVEAYAFVNETVDGEGGIRLRRSAMEDASPGYMEWANIREMHGAKAIGNCTSLVWDDKGAKMELEVVDDDAWKKVQKRVYKGLSVGVAPVLVRGKDVEKCRWVETSLVDRPKDPGAKIIAFRAVDIAPEYEAEVVEGNLTRSQGPYPPATLQMNSMGHIHAFSGHINPVQEGQNYKDEQGNEAPAYFQGESSVNLVKEGLPKDEQDDLENGWPVHTTHFDHDHFDHDHFNTERAETAASENLERAAEPKITWNKKEDGAFHPTHTPSHSGQEFPEHMVTSEGAEGSSNYYHNGIPFGTEAEAKAHAEHGILGDWHREEAHKNSAYGGGVLMGQAYHEHNNEADKHFKAAREIRQHTQTRTETTSLARGEYKVPGIIKWNQYAGGTSSPAGKNSYDIHTPHGQYTIDPVQPKGYSLKFAHTGGGPRGAGFSETLPSGLWHDLGTHDSPQAAASKASEHHGEHFSEGKVKQYDWQRSISLPENWDAETVAEFRTQMEAIISRKDAGKEGEGDYTSIAYHEDQITSLAGSGDVNTVKRHLDAIDLLKRVGELTSEKARQTSEQAHDLTRQTEQSQRPWGHDKLSEEAVKAARAGNHGAASHFHFKAAIEHFKWEGPEHRTAAEAHEKAANVHADLHEEGVKDRSDSPSLERAHYDAHGASQQAMEASNATTPHKSGVWDERFPQMALVASQKGEHSKAANLHDLSAKWHQDHAQSSLVSGWPDFDQVKAHDAAAGAHMRAAQRHREEAGSHREEAGSSADRRELAMRFDNFDEGGRRMTPHEASQHAHNLSSVTGGNEHSKKALEFSAVGNHARAAISHQDAAARHWDAADGTEGSPAADEHNVAGTAHYNAALAHEDAAKGGQIGRMERGKGPLPDHDIEALKAAKANGLTHAVIFQNGQIGHGGSSVHSVHENEDSAKATAKRFNGYLTPGEKKYYKMRYDHGDIDSLVAGARSDEGAITRGISSETPNLPTRENLEGAVKCPFCSAPLSEHNQKIGYCSACDHVLPEGVSRTITPSLTYIERLATLEADLTEAKSNLETSKAEIKRLEALPAPDGKTPPVLFPREFTGPPREFTANVVTRGVEEVTVELLRSEMASLAKTLPKEKDSKVREAGATRINVIKQQLLAFGETNF